MSWTLTQREGYGPLKKPIEVSGAHRSCLLQPEQMEEIISGQDGADCTGSLFRGTQLLSSSGPTEMFKITI